MSESLKDFSLRIYALDGVRDSLLDLQDKAGCDVALVLWCLWLAAEKRVPGPSLPLALDWSRTWGAEVTTPLRTARRAAKTPAATDAAIETFRQHLKALELDSEFITLQRLEADAPGCGGAGEFSALARDNLADYACAAQLTASF